MELYQWEEKWGVSSSDVKSVYANALLRIAGVEYSVVNCNNEDMSPSGELPFVRYKNVNDDGGIRPNGKLYELGELNDSLLSLMGHDVNDGLTVEEEADSVIMQNAVEEKFHRALIQMLWGETDNFNDCTRFIYVDSLPFPINYIIPFLKRSKMLASLRRSNASTKEKISSEFKSSLKAFSDKLGDDKLYIFGSSPHSIDALLYSYIILFLSAPVKNTEIQSIVKSFPNLCNLANRIHSNYFAGFPQLRISAPRGTEDLPSFARDSRKPQQSSSSSSSSSSASTSTSAKSVRTPKEERARKRTLFFYVGSVALFLAYAAVRISQLAKIVRSHADEDDEDDEDEDEDEDDEEEEEEEEEDN